MTRTLRLTLLLLLGTLLTSPAYCLPSLQLFIDLTPLGTTLRPPAGTYSGPIVISRQITLDGQGEVTIDGGGKGTVLTVKADNTVIRGLHLTNSGESHNALDAGLQLKADNVVFENNALDNVLFGINIHQGNDNTIRGNRISSKAVVSSLRGEGIRLWYSRNNHIEENEIIGVRDLLLTNSAENQIIGNRLQNNRISMEFIFSPKNEIRDNHISNNDTGIVAIYSDELDIRNNRIEHIRNTGSSAIAIKESSQVTIANNEIVHNAVGLTANSPVHPENILYLLGNHFTYNNIAIYFYGEKGGHIIHDNHFDSNLTSVAVSAPISARYNDWRNNHWDNYEGFDLDGNNIGDLPHNIYLYADRIWMDRPTTQFFRSTPTMEFIDFIERLAPFSPPALILIDPAPRTR
ncbi:MAG: copper ABC transporter substrate-binding protein [Gammaproteobacteria bacterium (ex Lamellibrachia satsuma)]|nr:MAG: nitrous oxide reductase family maturation protein NosD [Gammaproteobacteria bacterium (ex Lamellibrachia satsuma)]RRS31335.1 MAG: copper ABC transporter substrate-binding protein [Gammaproteobacteria bacterium (ex Lamellibrachia satsuma)]RRS36923.1 MAG: copper ABC transporter substrate-binding protein [Gammaproteobacteria bacterium (ex Lamellibrachia satsuma)]